MTPDTPRTDPLIAAWRHNEEETQPMSVDALRNRATRFHTRIALRNQREYLIGAAVALLFAWQAVTEADLLVRLGAGFIVLACAFVAFQLHRRGQAAAPDMALGAADCTRFHRAELIRQRDALNGVFGWYLAPFLPGLGLMAVGRLASGLAGADSDERMIIWIVNLVAAGLVALVFFAVWKLNRNAARQLQAEIEEIDALQGGR